MAQRLYGGWQQRLAQLQRDQADEQPVQSNLASQLISLWAWGQMSAPLVQALASAALKDGLQHPHIQKLAKMGGRGKYPANMQRDLLIICGDFTKLGDCTSKIPIRLKTLQKKKNVSSEEDLTFLLPHKLFSALYHNLHDAFVSSVLGGKEDNVGKFWAEMKKHPFVLARPELQNQAALKKVVPIAIHGDGVSYMQAMRAGGKTLEVLSWSSLLSSSGPTKHTNYLIFLLVKNVVKDYGLGQTWPRVWKILCWSLEALNSGLWPMTNWDGGDFEEDTADFKNRGKALAGGFSATLFLLRSDLEFLANHFKLNNYNSNFPCSLCKADRDTESLPWTDCRAAAGWRATVWTRDAWAAENPNCHPLFRMPGAGLDLVSPDLMHCKHLGTDQLLLGSALTWLIKHYLAGSIAQNLAIVWEFIQTWYKDLSRN